MYRYIDIYNSNITVVAIVIVAAIVIRATCAPPCAVALPRPGPGRSELTDEIGTPDPN